LEPLVPMALEVKLVFAMHKLIFVDSHLEFESIGTLAKN
jgi:hypothetical protein